MSLPYKLGSSGVGVTAWQKWAKQYAKSYADILGPVDGYYGNSDAAFTREMQRRLGVPQTGVFDATTAQRVGYKAAGVVVPAPKPYRPIWIYTAPGSGADWWVGPSFELGEWCKTALNLNHQPVGFPKGGYLGFLGGSPDLSYNEVITAEKHELARLIRTCPDRDNPNLEIWCSGYSQSADGMRRAVAELFGDGGEFAHLRSKLNGVVNFGDPSKPETGIARTTWQAPAWLNARSHYITTKGDFYAEVPASDKIRPAFYGAIVQAEMELPFFVYVLKIAVPIISEWAKVALPIVGPMLGGFGPLMQMAIGMIAGAQGLGNSIGGNPLLGNLLGQAGGVDDGDPVPEQMLELLSPTGVLANIPGLIGLIAALPGLQAHGEYWMSKPEFGGRTGIQVACDLVRTFGTQWHN